MYEEDKLNSTTFGTRAHFDFSATLNLNITMRLILGQFEFRSIPDELHVLC